jgi:hypothetical protein
MPPGTVTAAQGEQPAASRRWHPQHIQQHWHADTAPASHARAAHAHIYDTTAEFTQHACKQALHVAGNKRNGGGNTCGENDASRRQDRRRQAQSPNYRQRLDCNSSAHKPTCGDARGGLRGTHARTRRCCAARHGDCRRSAAWRERLPSHGVHTTHTLSSEIEASSSNSSGGTSGASRRDATQEFMCRKEDQCLKPTGALQPTLRLHSGVCGQYAGLGNATVVTSFVPSV